MTAFFFDTHTHLDYLAQDTQTSIPDLVLNATQSNVAKILIMAVVVGDFKKIQNQTALCPEALRYGLGLHPLYIRQHQVVDLDTLEAELRAHPQGLTAVGEIGLERAISDLLSDDLWLKQQDFFEAQLQLARYHQFPVNIHSRKSHDHLFAFLKRIDLAKKGVVHGFAGSYEQAKRFVDLGYKIGVGGTITYVRAHKTRQAIARLPLDALLLETDSPDMPVFGFQGEPNRPERLVQIFSSLCQIRQESPEIMLESLWQNSLALFD